MVDVLQDKREAIAELCVRHGVARLDVFGSDPAIPIPRGRRVRNRPATRSGTRIRPPIWVLGHDALAFG